MERDGWMEALPGGVFGVLADEEPVELLGFSETRLLIRASHPFMKRHPVLNLSVFSLDRKTDHYEVLPLAEAQETNRVINEEAVELSFQVENSAYVRLVRASAVQMAAYIRDRMESESGYFLPSGEALPPETEAFSTHALAWFKARRTAAVQAFLHSAQADSQWETAAVLDRPECREAFLFGKIDVSGYDRLYFGSSWCARLYPEVSELHALLARALKQQKKITVCLSPVTERELEKTAEKLAFLGRWGQEHTEKIEVVVNDWGTFSMIESPFLVPVCGPLLNRRRRDPRLAYAAGAGVHEQELRMGTVNEPSVKRLLKKLGVTRIEYEAGGMALPAVDFEASLSLPLYETALSETCALAAVCLEGDRGKQHTDLACGQVCRDTCLLYPEGTDLIGIGNVLWGFDRALTNGSQALKKLREAGFTRLVWNMLLSEAEEEERS